MFHATIANTGIWIITSPLRHVDANGLVYMMEVTR
jgi:hypothetical protein